jgi:hypothetical protein
LRFQTPTTPTKTRPTTTFCVPSAATSISSVHNICKLNDRRSNHRRRNRKMNLKFLIALSLTTILLPSDAAIRGTTRKEKEEPTDVSSTRQLQAKGDEKLSTQGNGLTPGGAAGLSGAARGQAKRSNPFASPSIDFFNLCPYLPFSGTVPEGSVACTSDSDCAGNETSGKQLNKTKTTTTKSLDF